MRMMKQCLLGNKIKHAEDMIDEIGSKKVKRPFFIVCFKEGSERMEVLSNLLFLQKSFNPDDYLVAGIFYSQDEAFEMIRRLTEISYSKYGDLKLYQTMLEIKQGEV